MNPVARLAWLRFLLHIPGRCQGPHRRQGSLPKSQPCYTDECVSPVLWSRLSAYVFLCMPLCAVGHTFTLGNEIRGEYVGWSGIAGSVCRYGSSTAGGSHAEVNCHNPHPVVTIIGRLSTPSRADNFLSTVYTIHPLFMLPSIIHHGDITNNNTTILCFHCEVQNVLPW